MYLLQETTATKGINKNPKIVEGKKGIDGIKEQVPNNNYDSQPEGQAKINGSRSCSGSNNGPHIQLPITTTITPTPPPPLPLKKSNLKRSTTRLDQINQSISSDKRKVSWPDAHGKDIAHVHEFEPSLSEDGELEGVRNSCICTIQ